MCVSSPLGGILYNRRMSRFAWLLLLLSLVGCGKEQSSSGDDDPSVDASIDAPHNPFKTVATFNPAMRQQPDGVVSINNVIYVGLAPLGQIVKITAPGAFEPFGQIPGPVSNTLTLGLAANIAGEIFIAVAAAGPNPTPLPGVYKLPATGGMAQLFSRSSFMIHPNGIDVHGGKLYVTDSEAGRIIEITQTGNASVWLEDPLLAGSTDACGGTGGAAVGANGIAHDADNRYVSVTDHGRIVRIPLRKNGAADPPVVHAESCDDLRGVDGIMLEAPGQFTAVRGSPANAMVSILPNGTVVPIHVGTPLDGPASIAYDALITGWVITNAAPSLDNPGKPSVVGLSSMLDSQ
jgi:hypothetical protein